MESSWIAGLLFLWLGCSCTGAQTTKHDCKIGGTLELGPPRSTTTAAVTITGVQWRHNEDIVAEWMTGDPAVETYNNFQGRTHLNTSTGLLTVSRMTTAEAGVYTVEINSNRLDVRYVVAVLKAVPTPEVWPKPKDKEDLYELACEGVVEGAEPVTYWWNLGEDRAWVQLGQKIVIANNDTTRQMETFSCKMKNAVSEEESAPKENPFFSKPGNPALGALAILPIIAIAIGLGYWKKDSIRARLCAGQEANKVDAGAGGEGGEGGANVPLNENRTEPNSSPE